MKGKVAKLIAAAAVLILIITADVYSQGKIAFDSCGDGNCEIYLINPDGTGETRLTFNAADDRKADVAFWRLSTGEWFVLRSENLSYYSTTFGAVGDGPAPGDYDGDGKHDPTVFRPSTGTWYTDRSTGGALIRQFGVSGDRPIPNAFIPWLFHDYCFLLLDGGLNFM